MSTTPQSELRLDITINAEAQAKFDRLKRAVDELGAAMHDLANSGFGIQATFPVASCPPSSCADLPNTEKPSE